MKGKVFYNDNPDDWHNCCEHITDAVQMIIENSEEGEIEVGTEVTLYHGVEIKKSFKDFFSVGKVIDSMSNCAYDECGEIAGNYLLDLTENQIAELDLIINYWAERHKIKPSFSIFDNVKEIKYKVTSEYFG